MSTNLQVMDGCTAATYVAYAMSEVATIYPITPIASMGETADKWAVAGRKNLFGTTMAVKEMESELGAAGATHGALAAGALATTFTSSQGLMLMIPNMYKIAGELLPGVFHVGTRSLATHALSIFGDHQDVMACRATGFAFLASCSVQETMDLALVAHLAAIDGRVPVVHFFDGWRTSNETAAIETIPYETMRTLVNWEKVDEFRKRGMNPDHPDLRGSAQNPDVYFQNREAANKYYDQFPDIVQSAMKRVGEVTGRRYNLVDYVGSPDATDVLVSIGSSCQVVEESIDYLNAHGYKVGLIKVRLFRPFPTRQLLDAIPKSAIRMAVLDRTKEPGSQGEPLLLDVCTALQNASRNIKVIGGRYGLGSKEFNPVMVKAIVDELMSAQPRRQFTVGIDDDVTGLSLDISGQHFIESDPKMHQSIFYGMGSDGTVGATRQLTSIITAVTGNYTQAFFNYSAKKSGGYTISQLRFSPNPIKSEYSIVEADYIGCNKDVYVDRFNLLDNLKQGGIFVLNSAWTAEQMEIKLPAALRRQIAQRKAKFFNIDAFSIARKTGLGVRINTIMSTVFLHLMSDAISFDKAIAELKKEVTAAYMHEGQLAVNQNLEAIDAAVSGLVSIDYPSSWAQAEDSSVSSPDVPEFIAKVARPCLRLEGNSLPVSALSADGTMPMGTTAYEKRRIANFVPLWNPDRCVQCTLCSMVCAHAAIRPFLLSDDEQKSAPEGFDMIQAKGNPAVSPYRYHIQVYPEDCTGCGSCAVICPGKALTMTPIDQTIERQKSDLEFVEKSVSVKDDLLPRNTVYGSQMQQPLLQFSGACAGCGETPYVKLLTQLFGDRMLIANATGCSSIWGANFPSNAYCTNSRGQGPAWGNSLFEDNAEYAYGMAVALQNRPSDSTTERRCVWAVGGDGWAYDIGFAGLDHVLAQNININILVMDTECYSNTGGQTSKATPLGAVMKYASDGKRTYKKDLGRMMMTYGNIYVASIALGANYQQAINALTEAEAYPGPSLVIAYCPCINHGLRSGMSHSIVEEKLAVKAGYWPLYRFNPSLIDEGKDPLIIDSAAPDGTLIQFINGENRYADLKMVDPATAAILQPELAKRTERLFSIITNQAKSDLF